MIKSRSWAVYGMLAAIWSALLGWQAAEHFQVSKAFHHMLLDRGRYITTTCGLLLRGRFGIVNKERLESALDELVNTNELLAVQLVNTNGQPVASAGPPIEMPPRNEFEGGVYWGGQMAILENPVDVGTNLGQLVFSTNELHSFATNRLASTNRVVAATENTNRVRGAFDWRRQRPYWMTEEEYHNILEKKAAHTFVVAMSTEPIRHAEDYDLWMRGIIVLLGAAAVIGFALAWRTLISTSELQLRLVRASEQNLHLQEMNIAAAGLAHETRNPLNIIRGLAQMICKHESITSEMRTRARDIINETDRVTAQLNEFINYSRPREVRRAPTDISAVVNEVTRALNYDVAEKKIQIDTHIDPMTVEADEQLLRQALFNLVLNAVQAVSPQGVIRIRAARRTNEEAFIEVADNGPGVPAENRAEIFKPYFTTNPEGTGLGLSVVQQIVLAHGWEITCLPGEPNGALFRISHIKLKIKE